MFTKSPEFKDFREILDCPICGGEGWVLEDRPGRAFPVSVPCKCKPQRDFLMRMQCSGLSPVMHDYTFKKFKAVELWQTKIKKIAQNYTKNPDGWLYFGGQVGCGKTHLCTATTMQLVKSGANARYMLWRRDSMKLKAAAVDGFSEELENLETIDLLYIDDLFKGKVTDADINLAFELLNSRYIARMPTIISSELLLDELIDIDEAVGSRIVEMSRRHQAFIKRDPARCYRYRSNGEI